MEKERKAFRTPEELELLNILASLERKAALPRLAEVEPGALLHLVKTAWSHSQGRDGRKGHLSEQEIANKIGQEIGRPFSRNQFQAMFGDIRRSAQGPAAEPRRQGIPHDIARAYLRTALYYWSIAANGQRSDEREKIGVPIPLPEGTNLDRIIDNAVHAMFSAVADRTEGQELLVRCRPSPGAGVIGFYEDCGKQGYSIIYATPREPVKMYQPSRQILEWEALCESLLAAPADTDLIHVWALREPLISRDTRHTAALYGIGFFQTILMMAKALSTLDKDGEASLWPAIVARGVVVVKRHPDNDSLRRGQRPIELVADRGPSVIIEDMIFPGAVPDRWKSRNPNLRPDDLDLLVAVRKDLRTEYNLLAKAEKAYPTPPVVHYPAPSADSDESFQRLFEACRAFLRMRGASSQGSNVDQQEILISARQEGWFFFDIEAFIHAEFPLDFETLALPRSKESRNVNRSRKMKAGE